MQNVFANACVKKKGDKDYPDAPKTLKVRATQRAGGGVGGCTSKHARLPAPPSPLSLLEPLQVGKLNELLDRLQATRKLAEQAQVFRELFQVTTAEQMHWIVCIVLETLLVGSSGLPRGCLHSCGPSLLIRCPHSPLQIHASEHTFFKLWHRDAEEVYNSNGRVHAAAHGTRPRTRSVRTHPHHVGPAAAG